MDLADQASLLCRSPAPCEPGAPTPTCNVSSVFSRAFCAAPSSSPWGAAASYWLHCTWKETRTRPGSLTQVPLPLLPMPESELNSVGARNTGHPLSPWPVYLFNYLFIHSKIVIMPLLCARQARLQMLGSECQVQALMEPVL